MRTSRRGIIGAVAAIGLLTLLAAPSASAAPGTTATCDYTTISEFPGSWIGPRYAQVDVSFSLCHTDPQTGWTATITKSQTNATGDNTGFFLDGSVVKTVESSDTDKTFRLEIPYHSCLPRVGWPCGGSGTLSKDFYVDAERGNPVIWPQPATVPFPGTVTLYDTP